MIGGEELPIMCLEHPLSKNHKFLSFFFFGTYKQSSNTNFWHPRNFGSL